MKHCRHCKVPVIKIRLGADAANWYHVADSNAYRPCYPNPTYAEPEEETDAKEVLA